MKEVPCCESVDGENFMSAMDSGFLKSAPDSSPFQRSLGHIEVRKQKLLKESNGTFMPYDEITPGFTD